MVLVVTVITEFVETFVLGVYSSLEEAKTDYYNLLREQIGFPKLSALFREQFGFPLIDLDVTTFDKLMKDPQYEGFLSDYLHVHFVGTQPGELFDFTDWHRWNVYNLYSTLEMILKGRTGYPDNWLGKRRTQLFLKNVG